MAGDGESGNAGGLVTVTINGSGPYGFRLSGGDGAPMIVTKLRRQGKGHQAGLKEGDVVVGINGFNGRTMSHAAAMGLLESAVQSVELVVYRGPSDQVNSAYGEADARLRPLPPGAAPPPRVLPPPPTTETGEMVIDQPAFTRSGAEKFVVDVNVGQQHLTNGDSSAGNQLLWKPSAVGHKGLAHNGPRPMSALPTAGHGHRSKTDDDFHLAAPAAPMRAPSPGDRPRTVAAATAPDYSTGTWPGPISREPLNQEPVNFQVKRPPSKPWVWQPSVMYEIHTDVRSEPIEWQPLPEMAAAPAVSTDESNGRGGKGPHRDQPDSGSADRNNKNRGGDDETSIPKWALPLRSDYDWKKSYPWAGDENAAPEDEWEYVYSTEGELIRRKKKVFADSSFYDDPQHKYPTIEEQIKMARRVAQSLTSAGNVTARGQRMFLRRREKADRWVVSEIPTPGLASYIRYGGGQNVVRTVHQEEDETDDAELYYNPAPWAPRRPQQQQQPAAATPAPAVKTPFTGGRLPWKTDFDPSSAAASALRPPSPPPLPAPGTSFNHGTPKWQPVKDNGGGGGGGGGGVGAKAPPKGAGAGAAFNLAKELRGMKGRGGKMFAKRRAQAAEDERREELAEALKTRSSSAGANVGYDEDWTDSAAAVGSVEAEMSGESPPWNRELPPSYGQPVRLLELIEKTRASSPGRRWTQQTPTVVSVSDQPAKDPSSYGNFSIDYSVKSRGTFRPVRFKTPGGAKSVAPPTFEDDYSPAGVPVSDF